MSTSLCSRSTMILVTCTGLLEGSYVQAEEHTIEETQIIGKREDVIKVAGSAYVIDDLELQKFEFSDINRILRQAPGVYVQEEEGYGLRPNIGIRGSSQERSSRITLMEDGILVAPAPYADPSAYYFPTAARLGGVEVLKGPQTLRYGPYTVGGAINLVSTAIPDTYSGYANIEFGEHSEQRQHLWYGGTEGQWGYLLEAHQHEADGFHSIDRSSRDTGFDKEDYMVKLRWRSAEGAAVRQQLDLKLNYAEELSNASYLGLTDSQFDQDPTRRYGLTELDQMNNRQHGAVLRHWLAFNDKLALTSTLYRNDFERAWYKVDRIAGQSLGTIIADANMGDAGAQAILDGTADASDIRVKDNAREYFGEGIQFELAGSFVTGEIQHAWLAGVRWHEDEADRYQIQDVFNQTNGSLVYQSTIQPGSSDNRVEEAEARSLWLEDRMTLGALELSVNLRQEDVESEFTRYSELDRSVVASRGSNDTDEWLAGLGATYQLNEQWLLLAGVHEGFAPAGAGAREGTGPEESINYELGARYRQGEHSVDAILFFSDYDNTVINCSLAFPCSGGENSGTESLGEAVIKGLELAAATVLWHDGAYSLPARLTYTYTDSEVTEDSDTGSVLDGDNLRYLPQNVLSIQAGLEHSAGWSVYLEAAYIDDMCVDNLCERGLDNGFRKTDDYWVLDLSASYYFSEGVEVYVKLDNVLDEEAIVARSPAGARANKPQTGYFGVHLRF